MLLVPTYKGRSLSAVYSVFRSYFFSHKWFFDYVLYQSVQWLCTCMYWLALLNGSGGAIAAYWVNINSLFPEQRLRSIVKRSRDLINWRRKIGSLLGEHSRVTHSSRSEHLVLTISPEWAHLVVTTHQFVYVTLTVSKSNVHWHFMTRWAHSTHQKALHSPSYNPITAVLTSLWEQWRRSEVTTCHFLQTNDVTRSSLTLTPDGKRRKTISSPNPLGSSIDSYTATVDLCMLKTWLSHWYTCHNKLPNVKLKEQVKCLVNSLKMMI